MTLMEIVAVGDDGDAAEDGGRRRGRGRPGIEVQVSPDRALGRWSSADRVLKSRCLGIGAPKVGVLGSGLKSSCPVIGADFERPGIGTRKVGVSGSGPEKCASCDRAPPKLVLSGRASWRGKIEPPEVGAFRLCSLDSWWLLACGFMVMTARRSNALGRPGWAPSGTSACHIDRAAVTLAAPASRRRSSA